MPVSKPDYIGLEKLSKFVSQENLVRYFLCACAGGKGNGAIAAKMNVGPSVVVGVEAWLVKGGLIDLEGVPTEYGNQELQILKEQRKDYVIGLLDQMPDELKYFQDMLQKITFPCEEPVSTLPATIPEHDEPIIISPSLGYVEKKEAGGDMMAVVSEPSGPELLEEANEKTRRRTRTETEKLKYAVLGQINRGVLSNEVIAGNVDRNISPTYVSVIVGLLKDNGYVEGSGKRRHITLAGIEKLKPHYAEDNDVLAVAEPVIQDPEVKSPSETELVIQGPETKKSFRSESYFGLAKKNPRGTKELERIINGRGYGHKPSEGPYAKANRGKEVVAEKISDNPLVEKIPYLSEETKIISEVPKQVPAALNETPVKINEILQAPDTEIDDVVPESAKEYNAIDVLRLKFLMSIEFGLKREELEALFADDGGIYRVESRFRKEKLFSKRLDTYTLDTGGLSRLESLKKECCEIVPEYLEVITYLRTNKKMPPKAEPETVLSVDMNEIIGEITGEDGLQESSLAPISVPMQQEKGIVSELESEKTPEETHFEGKPPETVLLFYSAPEEMPENEPIQKISPVTSVSAPVAPSQPFLTITAENIEELAKDVGLLKKGLRYVIPSNENPRTLVASGRFQQIGLDYLRILQGTPDVTDAALFAEMKAKGWFEGANGNKRITEKGSNAECVLEWLKEYYKGTV